MPCLFISFRMVPMTSGFGLAGGAVSADISRVLRGNKFSSATAIMYMWWNCRLQIAIVLRGGYSTRYCTVYRTVYIPYIHVQYVAFLQDSCCGEYTVVELTDLDSKRRFEAICFDYSLS